MYFLVTLVFIGALGTIVLKYLKSGNLTFGKDCGYREYITLVIIFCAGLLFHRYFLRNNGKNNGIRFLPSPDAPQSYGLNSLRGQQSELVGHDKWIVVTSISQPTPQVETLSSIPGFKLIVVADMKTPSDWTNSNSDNVIFLSTIAQQDLGYKVLKHLPWNSYTRKVVGYLYAIQHGASLIYDTDDDNAPDDVNDFVNHFAFDVKNTTRGLLVRSDIDDNHHMKNPYAHFGQSSIWPRGYPLEEIGVPHNNTYTLCPLLATPLIQQGLVNGDPDVDAIFRLTRKQLYSPLQIKFDAFAPPVIYPPGIFAPFNSQNTVILYDALWSLLLPTSVAFRVTDIWRGYWAQRLLWELGSHLGFYSPHTTQLRNAHNYLKDFTEEDQIYKQTGNLVKLLLEWECPEKETFFGCMILLTEHMAEQGMWAVSEVALVEAWIQDLNSIGYQEPKRMPSKNPVSNFLEWLPALSSSSGSSQQVCLDSSYGTLAIFTGVDTTVNVREMSKVKLTSFCNFTLEESSSNSSDNSSYFQQFNSTLLVVTFNIPHYANIPLLDNIYRPFYPNILYCGELRNIEGLVNISSSSFSFSFVHANITNGYFAYECAFKAIEMNYPGITSYLVLSDDNLLNFWNLMDNNEMSDGIDSLFDRNEIWAWRDHFINVDTSLPYNSSVWGQWGWWRGRYGVNATVAALQNIYSSEDENVVKFCNNRMSFGINETTATYGESDVFHLPVSKQQVFYDVGKILRNSEVFLEIAVPILVNGISPEEKVGNLSGVGLWGGQRDTWFDYFNESKIILHPVKLSQVVKDEVWKSNYCEKYISLVLESY